MPPKQIESIKTTAGPYWITVGLDGKLAYVSSGDVIDMKTRKIVGQMKDEYGRTMYSEKLLDMVFIEGKLTARCQPVRQWTGQFEIDRAGHGQRSDQIRILQRSMRNRIPSALVRAAALIGAAVLAFPADDAREEAADKAAFQAVCGSCHALSMVEGLRTESEWYEEVEQMIKIGAKGTDEQFDRVMSILATHADEGERQHRNGIANCSGP